MTNNENAIILNEKDIHDFWEERAKRYSTLDLINISNLEADTRLAREKHRQELDVMMRYVQPGTEEVLLDLGAGHAAWSTAFAPMLKHVDAVEYSKGMLTLAHRSIKEQGLVNITLHHCAAQDFESDDSYDIVLLSGLTIYLNDKELSQVLRRMRDHLRPDGRIILRDGTGKDKPFTISNRYSQELDANYSAHYRTAENYIDLFARYGFKVRRHQNMFPDGSPLNKRKETILRVYEFQMETRT